MTKNKRWKKNTPNPGSVEAQKKGCTCPVMDNHYGRGAYGSPNKFFITDSCPLHHSPSRGNQ